jgi:hypothetical protein
MADHTQIRCTHQPGSVVAITLVLKSLIQHLEVINIDSPSVTHGLRYFSTQER